MNYEETSNYLAGLQNKNIPPEFQERGAQLFKLWKEVELFKCHADKTLQNIAVPHHGYESEDARGKGKTKRNLKRKAGITDDITTLKRSSCQQPDTIADNGEQMRLEYCSPSPLTVSSRAYQHTLVPRCSLGKGLAEKDDHSNKTYTSDTCNTEEITPTAYHNTLSINPRQGGQGGGDGNESDEDKEQGKYPSICKDKAFSSQKKKYVLDQSQSDLKAHQGLNNVLYHVDHAFNTRQKGNGTHIQETRDFVESSLTKFCLKSDTKQSSISEVLVSHSIQCERETCEVPVCNELKKTFEESETSLLDEEEFYETPWEVLQSVTPLIEAGSKITLNEKINILYEQKAGKGGFGDVNLTCLSIDNVEASMVIKKISPKGREGPDIDNMVKCLREIGQHKFLLTPDMILSTVQRDVTLLVMEKGVMSLHSYMKKTLHRHGIECQKVQSGTCDHIGVCNSGISAELCSYYFVQVTSAVKYLHDFDYVHGDIKSENIMLMPGLKHVKMIDFDFIKKEEQRKQCGSLGWAGPELFGKGGNATKSSDVWSTTLLIPHMYFGLQIATDPKKISEHLDLLKKRNVDIYWFLSKHQPELATLFARGTEWKSSDRPPIDKLLKCFTDNKTLRNLFNTKPNPRMVAPSDNKELSKRLIQNWLYPRTQSRFPLKKPSASAVSDDPMWGMDDMKRNLDEMQDEDVEAILRN